MSGYTKLYRSILNSTIWQESKETRLVWITLLALSEIDGTVESSIPGLAKEAGVSLPECEAALAILLAPDPYSRTKDHEGRRIIAVDGGWKILNREKYRDKRDDRAAYYRQYRAQHGAQQLSGCAQQNSTQTEKETEKKTDTEKEKKKEEETTLVAGATGFDEFWKAYPRKVGKEAARKAWQRIKTPDTLLPRILETLAAWANCPDWTKENRKYCPHPSKWLNDGRWDDDPPTKPKMSVDEMCRLDEERRAKLYAIPRS